jgi:hypothetical protein
MSKRIFDTDPVTGITRYWHMTEKGEFVIETEQRIEVDESNTRARNATDRRTKWGDMSRVASIPLSVYYDLKRRGIADDPKAMKRWLNDADNRVFRTREGVL